jgi:3-oxoacyl-[acyl-carrier protein] reductase
MNLGIAGRNAIICGSSAGLGRACAEALAAEGVNIILNGRRPDVLETTVAEIANKAPGSVKGVAADATHADGLRALLDACPEPDIVVTNTIGPLPKHFEDIGVEDWEGVLRRNMLAPMELVRLALPSMKKRRFGRVINITSAMVTTPRPHMVASAGPRAGLTAVMKGLSLEVAASNITINNLLPERFDTDRQHQMALATARREAISYEAAREKQVESIAARRLGKPGEFGATCAFLCSDHASFISGQNIHLDGGSYPALL